MRTRELRTSLLSTMLTLTLALTAIAVDAAENLTAQQVLEAAGVQGGLIVHVGCGDGRLAAALSANESYCVHGLDGAKDVAKARKHLREVGLDGRVAVDTFDGTHLPYIDQLVNLLVVEDLSNLSMDDVKRVLAPNGVALILKTGKETERAAGQMIQIAGRAWSKIVKPWPADIDEWTHYLHNADNNAVAQDTVIGPPKHFQWIGGPHWLRHHDHMSALSAMVSAKGRVFYIMDLGPRWSVQMPPRWTLIARDGFSGVILWQRPIPAWHPHLWPLKRGPAQLMRRLVADGDTIYVTLSVGAAVTVLDAATGHKIHTLEGTEGAEEMLLSEGVLLVLADPQLDGYKNLPRDSVDLIRRGGRDWNWDERPRRLLAIDAGTREVLWSQKQRVAPVTLAAAGGRLYFHDGDRVVCRDGRSGNDVWSSKPVPRWDPMHVLFGPTLVVHEDVILFAGGENMDPIRGGKDTMTGLSAKTGEVLWTAPHPPSGYASSEDLFVVNGLVWCGETTSRRDSGVFTGRDPRTGEVKVEFSPDDPPHMPHHRCYRAKATSNFLLTSRTGIEFVDVRNKEWTIHHWVRGSCNYGIMPCNGLVYSPPHSCACYPVAKLNSFNALRGSRVEGLGSRAQSPESRAGERLERGPAFARPLDTRPSTLDPAATDWPTYRQNGGRSGSTKAGVSADLKSVWQADIGGKLSSVVMAENRAYVAAVDRHTVYALDAPTGKTLWDFAAGGRVDSPPTVWQGRVLFGSADGFVYCLNAEDGELVWRFRAAPEDRRLMAFGQMESVWPVHGSVLVREGIVYCVAGRTMWLDGGMRLLRLDARTGEKLSETVLDDKYPGTADNLQRDIQWPNLPVALPDVLSSDGRHVYMRSQPFNLEGERIDVVTPRDYTEQRGEVAHLFSPTGFLDDSWWHRSYWLFGRSFIGGAGGWYLASYQAPSGRILSVDDSSVYGFGRAPLRFTGTPNTYHLFACDKEPEIIGSNQPPRKQGGSVYGKVVPTRLTYHWSQSLPFLVRAMVATDQALFVAGPPAVADEEEVYGRYGETEIQAKMEQHVAAFEGGKEAFIMAVSKADGHKLSAYRLPAAPVFDGMAAAGGRLFVATMDGQVLCLGDGDGRSLEAAPDVQPGPVSTARMGFSETKTHPDFQQLVGVQITPSDIGYRMRTAPREVGLALRKLETPLTKQAEFRVNVRPTPDASSPDKPGNAFIAFGNAPTDEQLVKCGFRISGKALIIVQGPLLKGGKSKSTRVAVNANEVAEVRVIVDLDSQTVAVHMHDQTVEVPLQRPLESVTWVGHCLTSVTSDFGKIDVSGE